ncbi:MAG: DUF748 domain-containing protein [Methylococcaceae bacterium]|nr:DUF748 domain-containing protein [Methylococcaceae bacterium]
MAFASRKRRAVIILGATLGATLGVYALAGFFLAPYLIQSRLWPMLSQQLGGHFLAEHTALNPFALSVTVNGFALKDPGNEDFLGIAEIRAELDAWSSLRDKALVLKGRIVQPTVNLRIDQAGKPNFAFLLSTAGDKQEKPPAVFPFLLTELTLEQGRLALEDHSRGAGIKTAWSPWDFNLENLGTLAHEPARFKLEAQGEDRSRWMVEGNLDPKSLESAGELRLDGLNLAPLAAWLAADAPLTLSDGSLDLQLKYRLAPGGQLKEIAAAATELAHLRLLREGKPLLDVGSAAAAGLIYDPMSNKLVLNSFQFDKIELPMPTPVRDEDGKTRMMSVGSLKLGDIAVSLADKTLSIATLTSNRSVLALWREKDGSLGLPFLPAPAAKSAGEKSNGEMPWKLRLGLVELNDNDIALRDFSFEPPAAMRLAPLNLKIQGFDSASDKPFNLGMNTGLSMNGRIALESDIVLVPLTADVKLYVDDLSLPPFQAYLDPAMRIRLVNGAMNLNADIHYGGQPGDSLRIGGDVAVANFATADKREGKDFVNWKSLRLNGLIFEDKPSRLSIREIDVNQPYARVFLDPDGKFNLTENLSPPAKAQPSKEKPKASEPLPVVIGSLHIHGGHSDFTDMTIKPTSFSADIHELDGTIRGLSSRKDAKADVLLLGKLNEGSQVKISGKINPFQIKTYTDIAMEFHDVNLTTLSPYSGKFAGYRIEKGKLSMNLRYRLEDGQLKAENQFVLDHIVLGERVESPDATSLPVQLAISLLKDADGKIDLSLPISGDLSNPDISLRGLLASATTELISKLVTSPFTLLGNLVASGGEDMEAVKFAPGQTALSSAEKDKLALIAKALQERPALNLEIKASAHPQQDSPVLAEVELGRQLKNMKLIELGMEKGKKAETVDLHLSEEDYNRLLTQFYRAKLPDSPELKGLKSGAWLSGGPLESAKHKLLEHWSVSEIDLRSLAQARGESIRNYLIKEAGLPDQRIYLLDVRLGERDEKEIKALLSLSGS